ncbi:UNVERIFIED_CONTAM: hypothetical protein HDU68_007613 [Siphonaria sp. JEL0065]|nr:hypothetical protein HDU68_007613 [Siphonaria sp. JEL0065]
MYTLSDRSFSFSSITERQESDCFSFLGSLNTYGAPSLLEKNSYICEEDTAVDSILPGTGAEISLTMLDGLFAELEAFDLQTELETGLETEKENTPLNSAIMEFPLQSPSDTTDDLIKYDGVGQPLTKHQLRRRSSTSKPMKQLNEAEVHELHKTPLLRRLSVKVKATLTFSDALTPTTTSGSVQVSPISDTLLSKPNSGGSNLQSTTCTTGHGRPKRPSTITPFQWKRSLQSKSSAVALIDPQTFFEEGKRQGKSLESLPNRTSFEVSDSAIDVIADALPVITIDNAIPPQKLQQPGQQQEQKQLKFGMKTLVRSLSWFKRKKRTSYDL